MAATLQAVFERSFVAYARRRSLPSHLRTAARAISQCRTAALGGHVLGCPQGHVAGVWYNSCRHRSCPQCNRVGLEQWLDTQRACLLDCDHYHVVFTTPHELEPLWHTQRGRMTKHLYDCARQTLFELLSDPKYLGAQVGVIATLHTWGRTLNFHPHVHCLVTGGGWNGVQWKPLRTRYLLPVGVVRTLFRAKLLSAIREDLDQGHCTLPTSVNRVAFDNTLRRLWQKTWNVRLQGRYDHGRGVLVYLARYLRGGPVSNRRLLAEDADRVVLQYTDHRDGRTKTLALAPDPFLQRVLWHVPEPGTHAVRYWGLYARCHAPRRACCRTALRQAPEPLREVLPRRVYCERKGWIEPMRCPVCQAPLAILEELPRGRAPPWPRCPIAA